MGLGTTGSRVALTRQAADNAALAGRLAQARLRPVLCPLVRVALVDPAVVRLAREQYDWVAATSRRALVWLDWRAGAVGGPRWERLACVGSATADYARHVLRAEPLVPRTHTARALAQVMGDVSGASVLWPRGDLARPTLGDALRQAGADVEEAVVYRTLPDPAGAARLRDLTADGALEAVVFASPSAVASALAGGVELSRLRCYSIGPATTDALQASGVAVAAQAESHDDDGLLAAIVKSETR